MILSDTQILTAINKGDIVITPFERRFLGSNSYDVHLGDTLMFSKSPTLDCAKENEFYTVQIPETGFLLRPNTLYLGVTVEYTEAHRHLPVLEGKSSIGRLGLDIHITAGFGDTGFCGNWTLELRVVQPLIIYPLMPIGQLVWHETGKVQTTYDKKPSAHYASQAPTPVPSKLWKGFEDKRIKL